MDSSKKVTVKNTFKEGGGGGGGGGVYTEKYFWRLILPFTHVILAIFFFIY